MNLFLRPHENPNDPVWSVIVMIAILLCAALYMIVYILGIDEREANGSNDATQQEELLQLQGSED
jgi:Ca2+/Na+ antiporter|tara:strand:+ start:142 stop:336 length:195 start_codon:yes stop_codon:yes gene_type:complete